MVKTQIKNVFEFYATQKELALLTTLNIQSEKIKVNIINMTFNQKLLFTKFIKQLWYMI